MQFKFLSFECNFHWLSTAIVLVCIPLFIKLGLWQYHKAELRQSIQNQYVDSLKKEVANLRDYLKDPTVLQFQQTVVSGYFETQFQFLIDNQVENSQPGFHVITPFKIDGSELRVLVNRGWIAGDAHHEHVPAFDTPTKPMQIKGMVWIPSSKIFTLEAKGETPLSTKDWKLVWQHLDMKKYQQSAPIKVLDVIIKLDPTVESGGFVRRWQMPPSKIMTNLGYAYQWFGFAVATLAIYLYSSVKRIKTEE